MNKRKISPSPSVTKFPRAAIFCITAIFTATLACRTHQAPDDQAITAAVRAKLHAAFSPMEDRQVTQFDRGADLQTVSYISVSSVNGVVTLTGEVPSRRTRDRAGEIARSVKEVVAVHDNLSISPGYSSNDAPAKE
jgi:BON domain